MPKETETVTEYQTVEKTEEVERTYCDVCGERCDDEYSIAPAYECAGCNEASKSFGTMRDFKMWVDKHHEGTEPESSDSKVASIIFIAIAPLTFTMSVVAAFGGEGWEQPYLEGAIGTALWIGFVLALLLIL